MKHLNESNARKLCPTKSCLENFTTKFKLRPLIENWSDERYWAGAIHSPKLEWMHWRKWPRMRPWCVNRFEGGTFWRFHANKWGWRVPHKSSVNMSIATRTHLKLAYHGWWKSSKTKFVRECSAKHSNSRLFHNCIHCAKSVQWRSTNSFILVIKKFDFLFLPQLVLLANLIVNLAKHNMKSRINFKFQGSIKPNSEKKGHSKSVIEKSILCRRRK